MNLQSQTTKIAVVISLADRSSQWCTDKLLELTNTFNDEFNIWSAVVHDKDTTTNLDGIVIQKHTHIHFIGIGHRKRLLNYLNQFSIWFECSTLAVSIDKLTDFTTMCQYLIHKNDLDKFQYSKDRIFTNMSKDELDTTLNAEIGESLTADKLMFIIGTSNNVVEVINRVGLSNFQHYYPTIKLLMDTYKVGFMQLRRKDYDI